MRTSETYRNNDVNTPNFKLVKNYFDKFASELNCQSHTNNKWCETTEGILRFLETSFTTFSEGSITIRYYMTKNTYTAVFENEHVRLRVFFATNTKSGNTVRLYDGEQYYSLGEDYLRDKTHLENIVDFIDGMMYSEYESSFEEEESLFFKTKI